MDIRNGLGTRVLAVVVWLALGTGCASKIAREPASPVPVLPSAPLLFMSDFGITDDSVALCKGVMWSVNPALRVVDITHQVTPYSILEGARYLAGTTQYYPPGSVFVVVVDPGVGSDRKAIVAKSKKGHYFVLPDNGLLTMVEDQDGLEGAREITNRAWMIQAPVSSTFHGRDIFSPVGAHLSRGEDWTLVGPPIEKTVRLGISAPHEEAKAVVGEVVGIENPYGNLITNVKRDWLEQLGYSVGDWLKVKVGGNEMKVRWVKFFSFVPVGQPLLYIDSRDRVAMALNQGNFATHFRVHPPTPISLEKKH